MLQPMFSSRKTSLTINKTVLYPNVPLLPHPILFILLSASSLAKGPHPNREVLTLIDETFTNLIMTCSWHSYCSGLLRVILRSTYLHAGFEFSDSRNGNFASGFKFWNWFPKLYILLIYFIYIFSFFTFALL